MSGEEKEWQTMISGARHVDRLETMNLHRIHTWQEMKTCVIWDLFDTRETVPELVDIVILMSPGIPRKFQRDTKCLRTREYQHVTESVSSLSRVVILHWLHISLVILKVSLSYSQQSQNSLLTVSGSLNKKWTDTWIRSNPHATNPFRLKGLPTTAVTCANNGMGKSTHSTKKSFGMCFSEGLSWQPHTYSVVVTYFCTSESRESWSNTDSDLDDPPGRLTTRYTLVGCDLDVVCGWGLLVRMPSRWSPIRCLWYHTHCHCRYSPHHPCVSWVLLWVHHTWVCRVLRP